MPRPPIRLRRHHLNPTRYWYPTYEKMVEHDIPAMAHASTVAVGMNK
jgi:hypothetical protein